jgi:hypothetical protein
MEVQEVLVVGSTVVLQILKAGAVENLDGKPHEHLRATSP